MPGPSWPLDWKYGDRICIIGPSGSGKTRLEKSLIRQKSNVIVIDTKQDPKEQWDREGVVTERLEGLRAGRFIWRASPGFITTASDQSRVFETLLQSGPRVIVIDEGYSVMPTRGARLFATQARGKRVSFIFGAQRPATVVLFFITDANFWIVFWLANDDDRKRVQHAVGTRAVKDWKAFWDTLQAEEYSFCIFDNKGRMAGPYRLPDPRQSGVLNLDGDRAPVVSGG